MWRASLLAAAGLAAGAPAPAHAAFDRLPETSPLQGRDYLALADDIVRGGPARWDARTGAYTVPGEPASTRTNVNLLTVHAGAALRAHTGPARADARARRLVRALVRGPVAHPAPAQGDASVCWGTLLGSTRADHLSIDAQVAEALALAWQARRALGLDPRLARELAATVDGCAHHPRWRFPSVVLNQINWNADVYAAAATVTGRGDLLRDDYRRQLARFLGAARRPEPGMAAANLGASFAFHYAPTRPAGDGLNLDAPEYAMLVAAALRHHRAAVRAGMPPLRAADRALLRRWSTRLLAGSWTHAGYLNWDTGYGRKRWNSGQYWAFAQGGLLAIATSPVLQPDARKRAWAKALFDRGLLLYARWAREAGMAVAPQRPFGVRAHFESHPVYASRIAANAVRATVRGLGGRPAADPPPLYAFDPDTGRLAVTTPAYSTAIVPDNRGAFPYGGIDLARLHGPGGTIAANAGGTPPGAFGLVMRDRRGRALLTSQHATGSLHLDRAPRGAQPAGPFTRLSATGSVTRPGVEIRTRHAFDASGITTAWTTRTPARGTAEVFFPSWTGASRVVAELRDGRVLALRAGVRGPRLGAVARFRIGRDCAGDYVVEPRRGPGDARVGVVRPRREPTNPHPGPSLRIRLGGGDVALTARVEPVAAP
jgi:hypothetical protein